jgi:hypothetical protein
MEGLRRMKHGVSIQNGQAGYRVQREKIMRWRGVQLHLYRTAPAAPQGQMVGLSGTEKHDKRDWEPRGRLFDTDVHLCINEPAQP